MNIRQELIEWSSLKERLLQMYPGLAEDDPALIDSLDGETNLTDAIAKLIRSAEEDRTLAAALKIRIDEMQERCGRIEARVDAKRDVAAKAMEHCGLKKIEREDFTASLAAGQPKVVITDETALPAHVLVAQPPKVDKKAIAGLLKAGTDVPGATLSNAQPHLTVRRS